jgi:hypothetical protein
MTAVPINAKALTRALGWIGSVVAIASGGAGFIQTMRPKPAVHMWISKAPTWVLPQPVAGWSAPDDFGAVTVTILNDTASNLDNPRLQFHGLTGFRGMIFGPRDKSRLTDSSGWEDRWYRQVPKNVGEKTNDDPELALPPILIGDGLTVQAFGSNFDKVDPSLKGATRPEDQDKVWLISQQDSFLHSMLFRHHGWLVLSALLLASCLLLVLRA